MNLSGLQANPALTDAIAMDRIEGTLNTALVEDSEIDIASSPSLLTKSRILKLERNSIQPELPQLSDVQDKEAVIKAKFYFIC